jgi:hypothetical protein
MSPSKQDNEFFIISNKWRDLGCVMFWYPRFCKLDMVMENFGLNNYLRSWKKNGKFGEEFKTATFSKPSIL